MACFPDIKYLWAIIMQMSLKGLSMSAANLTGDSLAFARDVKRNAKCAQGPKAFVFKKERCGITFKHSPLGFNTNSG